MFACDCFLGFFFADVIGFGGNQGDELDAAFHEQVASIFGEGLAGRGRQDLSDDLLDRRCYNFRLAGHWQVGTRWWIGAATRDIKESVKDIASRKPPQNIQENDKEIICDVPLGSDRSSLALMRGMLAYCERRVG